MPSLAAPLEDEEHIDRVQRFHRLHRDEIGIARADADDVDPTSHAREYALVRVAPAAAEC